MIRNRRPGTSPRCKRHAAQRTLHPLTPRAPSSRWLSGVLVSPTMLLAAVLVAEQVSFVLVGSAALWLRGETIHASDIDVVPDPLRGEPGRPGHSVGPDYVPEAGLPCLEAGHGARPPEGFASLGAAREFR
jgi:hypothetical protein